jgi:hypothetical protein
MRNAIASILRLPAIKKRSKAGKAACKDATSDIYRKAAGCASAIRAIRPLYLQLSAPSIAVAYREDPFHAKQFFPDDKKNYKASYCTDTAEGNDRFPLFPQAPRCLAKG